MDIKSLQVRLSQCGLYPQIDGDTITVLGHTIRHVTLECSNLVGLGVASNAEILNFLTHEKQPYSPTKWDFYHLTRLMEKNLLGYDFSVTEDELKASNSDKLLTVNVNPPTDSRGYHWSMLLQRGSYWLTIHMSEGSPIRLGELTPFLLDVMNGGLVAYTKYANSKELSDSVLVKATTKTDILKHLFGIMPYKANISLVSKELNVTLSDPISGNTLTTTLPDLPSDIQVLASDIIAILDTYGFVSKNYSKQVVGNVIASLSDFNLPLALSKSLKKPISTKNELIYQLRLFAPNLGHKGQQGRIKVLNKGELFALQITTEYGSKNSEFFNLPLTLLELLTLLTETLSHVKQA